jgi:hypothetical protein
MNTPRTRKPKPRAAARPAPDPKLLLARLRCRLEKEQAALARRHQRLLRVFHAYERQHRLTARLQRRITRLASA